VPWARSAAAVTTISASRNKPRRFLASPARAGLAVFTLLLCAAASPACALGDAKRGAYLAQAAGCLGCHTEDRQGATPYAGGRALKTPFGTFYGPNITAYPGAGIGRWTQEDFARALRAGVRPDGAHYFPAFPYPAFTRITDRDVQDLWAFLTSLPPSPQRNRPHELRFPYGWRTLAGFWKWLYFEPGAWVPDASRPAAVNRGDYLVNALGHCGECHTPRNSLGALRRERHLGGGRGADGKRVPNLTPTRLKSWSDDELGEFLASGLMPDGDLAAQAMAEVVRNTTSRLSRDDLSALVAYLRALPPLANERP
jgi:mono/diheme cytochrome c family protein